MSRALPRPGAPRRLLADARGGTLVEFALVSPVLCLLLMAAMDVSHTLYVEAVLQGEVQSAARNSSLESSTFQSQQDALDARVRSQVQSLAGTDAAVTFNRRFYRNFAAAAAARAEPFIDKNGNNRCDNGETFQDDNHNNTWDADGADAGQGGAKDRTVYTVTVQYDRMFPFWRMAGLSSTQTLRARAILENQPYGDQGTYDATPGTGICK